MESLSEISDEELQEDLEFWTKYRCFGYEKEIKMAKAEIARRNQIPQRAELEKAERIAK